MILAELFDGPTTSSRTYSAKEYVVLPGAKPHDAYYLVSGKVRQFQIRDNGNEVVVNVYGPGAIVSLSWILSDADNDYFFQAIEPSVIKKVDATRVADALRDEPSLAFETLSRLVRGFDGMYQRLIAHGSNKALQRVMAELTIEAKRFGSFDGSEYTVSVSSSELAARTGMSREATSRALHTLQEMKIVSISKGSYRFSVPE